MVLKIDCDLKKVVIQ